MKSIFARHGIPRVLVSDNATCYASRSFKMFADEFNFEHRTSSPGYPQSNGKAKKSVGIVKGVLNKALDSNDDIYLALLAYRTAPMACGKSPSEMLMNRKLRNRLRHGRIGFGLMDKSQHSRSDNIIDDVLLLTYSSCYDSNS